VEYAPIGLARAGKDLINSGLARELLANSD
jgi:hypothetical protein